jgi:hypothetical protein
MPALKEMMRFVDTQAVASAVERTVKAVDPQRIAPAAPRAAIESSSLQSGGSDVRSVEDGVVVAQAAGPRE